MNVLNSKKLIIYQTYRYRTIIFFGEQIDRYIVILIIAVAFSKEAFPNKVSFKLMMNMNKKLK